MSNIMWKFNTARFAVICEALEETDPDLSWDEDGTIQRGIEDGRYDLFCAKVSVRLDGVEIAADYLGACIYSRGEFVSAHRAPDPMDRNCSIMRKARGEISICHYFPDMVSTAIGDARNYLANLPETRGA